MKQYVIDELRPSDYQKIKVYMDTHFGKDSLEGIYWIPVDEEQLAHVQPSHDECHPFFFAVQLDVDRIACELLVRTRNKIRCDCIRYATQDQRNWLIGMFDAIFDDLEIIT